MVVHDRLSLKNDRLLKNGGNCFPIFYTVIVKMRGEEMQVEIKIDVSCKEPKIVVVTDRMTDEINSIVQKLSAEHQTTIIGFKDDVAEILEPSDVYRVFAFAVHRTQPFQRGAFRFGNFFRRVHQKRRRVLRPHNAHSQPKEVCQKRYGKKDVGV